MSRMTVGGLAGLLGARWLPVVTSAQVALPRSEPSIQDGLLPQHNDGSTVDTRSDEVTSVTPPVIARRQPPFGCGAVAGRWYGDRRRSCYRAPRWRRGRSNAAEGRGGQLIAVVPEIRMVITVGTTLTQDMELSADDVIYMINTLITR